MARTDCAPSVVENNEKIWKTMIFSDYDLGYEVKAINTGNEILITRGVAPLKLGTTGACNCGATQWL